MTRTIWSLSPCLVACAALLGCSGNANPNPTVGSISGEDQQLPRPWHHTVASNPIPGALARYDANGSGRLERSERERIKRDFAERRKWRQAEILGKYDVNHNGVLDPDEMEAFKADQSKTRAWAHERALAMYDENGDGVLDEQERAKMRRDNEKFLAEVNRKVLEQYDTNHNGVLDLDEYDRFRADLQSRKQ